MQTSENSKAVAIVLLILLLLQLPLAYYLLYYRHILRYRYAVEKINGINKVLLSGDSNTDKLKQITGILIHPAATNIVTPPSLSSMRWWNNLASAEAKY